MDAAKRQAYVFAALDYDLHGGGPETFHGGTARSIAKGLWMNDDGMPTEIENASELEADVAAWLGQHPELMTRYTVVENAGFEGERDAKSFGSYREALEWMIAGYGNDERDHFHIAIATDNPDGSRSFGC